jgi:purine-nucleoside phosphorylase
VPLDGTTRQYLDGEPFAPVADFTVTAALVSCTPFVERRTHVGLMMTQDAFYRQAEAWRQWRDRGVLAVEMEAATIFTIALLRGLRAGAVCLVVDQVGDRSTWARDEEIAAGTKDLVLLGLEAAARLAAGES